MTIASVTDWNSRIVMCACCEMPEHPEPRTEFQHRDQQWSAAGWNWANYRAAYGQAMAPGFTAPIPDSLISYRTVSRHTTGTAITAIIYTITAAADAELGLLGSPAPNTEGGTTPLQPYAGSLIPVSSYAAGSYSGVLVSFGNTYNVTLTFSDAITFDDVRAIAVDKLTALMWQPSTGDDYWKTKATTILASTGYYDGGIFVETGYPGFVRLIAIRYRLGVPLEYPTPYYKIECDEVLFPDDTEVPPSLVTSRSWEYAGADEFSDWFEMEPPADEGEIRVCNLRVTSYHTPWGTKPHFIGERWTPPG